MSFAFSALVNSRLSLSPAIYHTITFHSSLRPLHVFGEDFTSCSQCQSQMSNFGEIIHPLRLSIILTFTASVATQQIHSAESTTIDMANGSFDDQVQALLNQLDVPLALPGHLIVQPLHCNTAEEQATRNAAVVQANALIEVPRHAVRDSPYYRCTTFKGAADIVGKPVSANSSSTYFENAQQAKAYTEYLATQGAPEAPYDPTLPTSDAERRELVAQLVAAFMSVLEGSSSEKKDDFDGTCKDSDHKKKEFGAKKYDMRMVEARCWEIVLLVEEKSTTPQSLTKPYGYENLREEKQKTAGDKNFRELFDGVLLLIRSWKAQAERLLDAPFIRHVVDDPTYRLRKGTRSKKCIDGRQKTNIRLKEDSVKLKNISRKVVSEQADTGDLIQVDNDLDEYDIEEIVGSPPKRPRFSTNTRNPTMPHMRKQPDNVVGRDESSKLVSSRTSPHPGQLDSFNEPITSIHTPPVHSYRPRPSGRPINQTSQHLFASPPNEVWSGNNVARSGFSAPFNNQYNAGAGMVQAGA